MQPPYMPKIDSWTLFVLLVSLTIGVILGLIVQKPNVVNDTNDTENLTYPYLCNTSSEFKKPSENTTYIINVGNKKGLQKFIFRFTIANIGEDRILMPTLKVVFNNLNKSSIPEIYFMEIESRPSYILSCKRQDVSNKNILQCDYLGQGNFTIYIVPTTYHYLKSGDFIKYDVYVFYDADKVTNGSINFILDDCFGFKDVGAKPINVTLKFIR